MDNGASSSFFQHTVEEDTKMFNKIRDSLKISGDMFLLGKPSEKILDLLLKLYHENIIRILKTAASGQTSGADVKFMTGILELKDGRLFIAISEDPEENYPDYGKKMKMLYSLLKQSNVEVIFPEYAGYMKNKYGAKFELTKTTDLFPDSIVGWRTVKGAGNKYEPGVVNKRELMGYDQKMCMSSPSDQDGPTTKYNYDDTIWSNSDLAVNVIHSIQYLNKRKNEGFSFIPYKKILYDKASPPSPMKSKEDGSVIFECNNGSTCSEAKLFSYMYNNLGINFDEIKGYIAYWVDNKLPPNHIIPGYCFSESIPFENKRLEELTTETLKLLNPDVYDQLLSAYPLKFREVFKGVVQPFALSCPGCFANYYPYTKGIMVTWDNSQCINSNRLRGRSTTTTSVKRGGRRRLFNKKKTNKKYNNKKKGKKGKKTYKKYI